MGMYKNNRAGLAPRYLKALAMISAMIKIASAIPTGQLGGCDNKALLDGADAYVEAQTAGQISLLNATLATNWKYQENNAEGDANKGIISKALKIDHRRTNVDTTSCATYTELIITDSTNPYVIGTQIHHNITDAKILMIDSIVSTTNSWLFNATKTLQYVLGEKWDPIPESKRDSRATIQAAGDAYMDMWSNATSADAVPWGTPCTRLEGSAYTGKGAADDSCKPGIPSNHTQKPNTNRRYVVDESMGSVSIMCVWQHMMNASDSHEFRLEGGKLRYGK
jgi:hypothetical protein